MPTSFASLLADVMTLTNRPDLVGETTLAIKAATLKAHQSDDYIKDFQEYSVQFSAADFYQSLEYKALIALWRKPRYIRKFTNLPVPGAPGKFLAYIEPEKVVDTYGDSRTDIYYVAGANIQIRSSDLLQYILVGVYTNPDITTTGFNSWIADDHPFAIIYEAAAIVFKTIGYDEQSATFRAMVAEQLQMLKQHAITGTGS